MNLVEAALRRVESDLRQHGYRWALVGGFAVSARAEPRFTRDVDIAVMVSDDAGAEALTRSLLADHYRLIASIRARRNWPPRDCSVGLPRRRRGGRHRGSVVRKLRD